MVGEVAVVQLTPVAMLHSYLPGEIVEELAWAQQETLLSKEVKDVLHRMVVDGSEGFVQLLSTVAETQLQFHATRGKYPTRIELAKGSKDDL